MKLNIKAAVWLAGLCGLYPAAWAQTSTVTGNIKGLHDKQVKVSYMSGKENKTDSVAVKDGQFTWKTNLSEPQQVYLLFPKMYYPFFAEKGHITITGIADSAASFKVTGSKTQTEWKDYKATTKELTAQENEINKNYRTASKEEQAAMEIKMDSLENLKNEKAKQYIAGHPSSFLSVALVSQLTAYGVDYAQAQKMYDMLDPKAQQTISGKAIADRIGVLKRSAIGSELIDFSQNDTTGSPVHFSALKGKYVLVDFWASWCGPCRMENPNVLKAYNQYKDKKFTVVGISLDDKGSNWKKAIVDDNMPWTELSDLKGWKNELATYYGIQAIPSNLLVDPSGKIIAKDLRGDELHKKLGELLD